MNSIREFCEKRKCNKYLTDAFIAYCKASISDYYDMGNNKTVTGILTNFTEKEVEELWNKFVVDLKRLLTKKMVT